MNHIMFCYVTVDLEDYKHATMMDMGIVPVCDIHQTRRGVQKIVSVLKANAGCPRITFFATGQVARSDPELIRGLSAQGHEIACHTDTHENVYTLNRDEFKRNILQAVKALQQCSSQTVRGFRAPNFSINKRCEWVYEVLEECGFMYDSSVTSNDKRENSQAYDYINTGKRQLYEFPVYSCRFFGTARIHVIGGSYFRLLPVSIIIRLMQKAIADGYVPIIYLHPSDVDGDLHPISASEMRDLSFFSRLKWSNHQRLWTTGNRSALKKLERVLKVFPNKGTLLESLPVQ